MIINNDFKYIIKEAIRNYDISFINNIDNYIFEYCTEKMYYVNNTHFIDFFVDNNYINIDLPILKNINLTKKNNNYLYKTYKCEFISSILNDNVWKWSWSNPDTDSRIINISKKIFNWALSNNVIDFTTKDILLKSEQQIINNTHLIILLSISLYLSKYDVIYNKKINNISYYYVLKNI